VLREVEQRLLSQDELIKANRLEIERRAQASQQQAMAWGEQIYQLCSKDREFAAGFTAVKNDLDEQVGVLTRKMRDVESLSFSKAAAASGPDGGASLTLVHGLRQDVDYLRNELAAVRRSGNAVLAAAPTPAAVTQIVHVPQQRAGGSFGSGSLSHGAEHWLGGGPHDAALVLWDEMQQQAQWEQIRGCQEEVKANTAMIEQLKAIGMSAPAPTRAITPTAPSSGGAMIDKGAREAVEQATNALKQLKDQVRMLDVKVAESGKPDTAVDKHITSLNKDIAAHKVALATLERKVKELENRPAQVKEVVKEVAMPAQVPVLQPKPVPTTSTAVVQEVPATITPAMSPSTPATPGGKVYVIGGGADTSDVFNTVEMLDVQTGLWSMAPPMLEKRMSAGAAVVNERLYVLGGSPGRESRHKSVEVFDPVQGRWMRCADLAFVRSGVAAASHGNFIFAVGGFNGHEVFMSVEKYDTAADMWAAATSMNIKRFALATATRGTKIYAMGGGDGQDVLDDVECYDVVADSWEACPPMLSKRLGVCSVTLGDDVYVIGGYDGESHLRSVEKMDLTGKWTTVSSMVSPRSSAAATVCGGYIYVCGGYDGESRIDSVERYNPATDVWEPVASMSSMRGGPAVAAMVL